MSKAIVLILLVPVMIIFRGFVLMKLWGWFIVSTFSLPSLGIVSALGISLTITMLADSGAQKQEADDFAEAVSLALAPPVLTLFLGWVFTLFM